MGTGPFFFSQVRISLFYGVRGSRENGVIFHAVILERGLILLGGGGWILCFKVILVLEAVDGKFSDIFARD